MKNKDDNFDPAWPIKGVMVDSARLTENYSFYRNLIPRLAKWGYNTLFAHFCDDEGCSIILENTPVLPTPGAFTVSQWKELITLACKNGITVIPEVECLGHTGYLTRLAQNKALREPPVNNGIYWSINPNNPESVELLKGVISEINEIFDSEYIHIGMDEADIGGSPESQEMLKHKPGWQIFGEYLNSIKKIVEALGKKTLCWGDHLLGEEALADMVDKDIVICNWLYGYDHSENYKGNCRYLIEKGFSVIGAPAGVWSGTLFTPNKDNVENLYNYAQDMRVLSDEYPDKILGMVNTLWNAYRHLPAVLFPVIYYGGRLFDGKVNTPDDSLWLNSFVEEEFGLNGDADKEVARALKLLLVDRRRTKHEVTMMPYDKSSLTLAQDKMIRFAADVILKISDKAKALLAGNLTNVKINKDEYRQWIASAEMISKVCSFSSGFHDLNFAGRYGNSIRNKSRKDDLNNLICTAESCEEDINKALSFWKNENRKYRNNFGTRREQKGQDTVFWEIKDSDHPIERLELSKEFLNNFPG